MLGIDWRYYGSEQVGCEIALFFPPPDTPAEPHTPSEICNRVKNCRFIAIQIFCYGDFKRLFKNALATNI
jgi:hypothetical protein